MHISHIIKKKDHEKILHVLRRHWFTFLPTLLLFSFLAILPPIVYGVASNMIPSVLEQDTTQGIGTLVISLYYLAILLFLYTEFVVFYLDVWVITDERIVDIEQITLFSRTISEADLFHIQDVTSDVHGIFPSLLHYGILRVKTASETQDIIFHDIPYPDKIREQMIDLSQADRKRHFQQFPNPTNPA